jgi:hypothetical protein
MDTVSKRILCCVSVEVVLQESVQRRRHRSTQTANDVEAGRLKKGTSEYYQNIFIKTADENMRYAAPLMLQAAVDAGLKVKQSTQNFLKLVSVHEAVGTEVPRGDVTGVTADAENTENVPGVRAKAGQVANMQPAVVSGGGGSKRERDMTEEELDAEYMAAQELKLRKLLHLRKGERLRYGWEKDVPMRPKDWVPKRQREVKEQK